MSNPNAKHIGPFRLSMLDGTLVQTADLDGNETGIVWVRSTDHFYTGYWYGDVYLSRELAAQSLEYNTREEYVRYLIAEGPADVRGSSIPRDIFHRGVEHAPRCYNCDRKRAVDLFNDGRAIFCSERCAALIGIQYVAESQGWCKTGGHWAHDMDFPDQDADHCFEHSPVTPAAE